MKAERGFTLAELIIVMVITSVLAVVAIPKLFDRSEFAARGARDFIASAMRYAQKSAIAMRRNVCVDIAGSAVTATVALAEGSDQACAAANALVHPGNGKPFADAANALAGGSTVAAPVSMVFDAGGRPLSVPGSPLAAALNITVNGHAVPVTIEPESGLVR